MIDVGVSAQNFCFFFYRFKDLGQETDTVLLMNHVKHVTFSDSFGVAYL